VTGPALAPPGPTGTGIDGGRTWSLRREWSRVSALAFFVLVLVATTSIVGVRGVVGEVQRTARALRDQSVAIADLRSDIVAHEQVAHKLLSGELVDRVAFLKAQREIEQQFAGAAPVFSSDPALGASLRAARRSWQRGLTEYHLWGAGAVAMRGNHGAENPVFGASSDRTVATLDDIAGRSLVAMDKGLARGASLERWLTAGVAMLLALALLTAARIRRRVQTDFVRPIERLHAGVLHLHAGEYGYPIAVSRRDELGELAEAFNTMSVALHDSHLDLSRRAAHDSLTGLANRESLIARLDASLASRAGHGAVRDSLLLLDVDDFKDVNDSLGHEGGDTLLVHLAARLTGAVRPGDLVSRLGGDEFAIAISGGGGASDTAATVERIMAAIREPFAIGGARVALGVSIGVAPIGPELKDAAEILRNADFAMYMAKGAGKNRYQLFDTSMREHMVGRAARTLDLRSPVDEQQLRFDLRVASVRDHAVAT